MLQLDCLPVRASLYRSRCHNMESSDSESVSDLQPQQHNDEDWQDWDAGEEDEERTQSLFGTTVLPSPEQALDYDAQQHSFDLRQYVLQHRLSEYDVIKVINFARGEVAAGRDPLPVLAAAVAGATQQPWSDDKYLMPVLPDDPLLAYDFTEVADSGAADGEQAASSSSASATFAAAAAAKAAAAGSATTSQMQHQARVAALEQELEVMRLRLAALTELPLLRELMEGEAVEEEPSSSKSSSTAAAAAAGAPSSSTPSPAAPGDGAGAPGPGPSSTAAGSAAGLPGGGRPGGGSSVSAAVARASRSRVDELYFESYSYFDIHRVMLGDKARTEAYRDALVQNPRLMKGAKVLDVGCGTGILSMFAAQGGAAAVVGLEASERMAGFARQVVSCNSLAADQGGPVSIVQGKVEEVKDIGHDKVDVIVSEWMGYALLFETMLDSVLVARDRWLRPGGAMLPDVATVLVAGASDSALDLDFWKDVYGLSMAPIADQLRSAAAGQVHVREVPASSILTSAATVHTMQLDTMTAGQQDFTAEFTMELTAEVAAGAKEGQGVPLSAVVLWFDTEFSGKFCVENPVTLSTSPHATPTHWMQAVMPLQQPVVLGGATGAAALSGRLSMARSKGKHRTLDISLEYGAVAADGRALGERCTGVFVMDVTGE